ncbi:MAG: hypothetical protein J0H71_10385 [Rhizobiales bacterium]|nr:hypothetical protein [Hyphomicrobiales bacterium]
MFLTEVEAGRAKKAVTARRLDLAAPFRRRSFFPARANPQTPRAEFWALLCLTHRFAKILDVKPAERLQRGDDLTVADPRGLDVVLPETPLIHGLNPITRHGPLPAQPVDIPVQTHWWILP